MDLDALSRGVLLVLGVGQEGREPSRGTAFAVDEGGLVVTAAHVIEGFAECLIVQGEPSGEHWGARGTVLHADKLADVAIIRTETRPPHVFRLNPQRIPTSSDHLVVWDWPDWQEGSKPLLERHARARPFAAIYTSSWSTRQGSPRLGFAARVAYGMSGGPVVAATSGDVSGLVIGMWRIDEEEIVDNWWDNVGNRYDLPSDSEFEPSQLVQSMKAHLALGMGIALPAERIAVAIRAIH